MSTGREGKGDGKEGAAPPAKRVKVEEDGR